MLLVVIGGQPEENVFRRKGSTFMRKKTRKFCAITLAAVMATTYMPYFPQGVVDLSYTVKAAQVTSGDFKYETNGASSISIIVSADTNSDGTYDKVVATETKSAATTASPAPGTENKDKENATETKTETATPSPYPGTENKNNTVTAENKTENTVTTQEVQTIKATTSKTFKVSKLKKKALTFKIAGKASSGNKIAYKLVKANKNIKFDAKTGIVTIKKGTKKGTYKIKVKMTVKGNSKYKAYATTRTITIRVKK